MMVMVMVGEEPGCEEWGSEQVSGKGPREGGGSREKHTNLRRNTTVFLGPALPLDSSS